jgi:hypothetical protein
MHFLRKIFLIVLACFQAVRTLSIDAKQDNIVNILQNSFSMRYQTWGIQVDKTTGMVYFATSNGLVEFDGLRFSTLQSPGDKALRSVYIDNLGRIFTGGFEQFGYWQTNLDHQLEYHSLSDSIQIYVNDEIWKIYQLGSNIYFQSFGRIYCFDGQQTRAIQVPGNLLFMFKSDDRFIVQVLDKGLYYFDGANFKFIDGSQLLSNIKVHALISLGKASFLACTEKDGIFIYKNDHFDFWATEISDYLAAYTCNAGLRVNDTTLVFGTILNGIVQAGINGSIGEIHNFASGLNNNTVLTLTGAGNGGVWAGLDQGANYFNPESRVKYFSTQSGSLGTIYALLINQDKLYLGSNHGLFISNIERIGQNYQFSNLDFIPKSQGQVWTLNLIDGQIICGHNDGTFVVEGHVFRKISDITGGWSIRPLDSLLLQGTYTGLVTFDKDKNGKWKFRSRLKGFYEPSRHIETDYMGNIWVSHPQKGIFRLQTNENRDTVLHIFAYPKASGEPGPIDVFKLNNRIVFTSGNGFYTYDYMKDSVTIFKSLNNSLGEYQNASQIIPFEKNLYWFVCNNKMALFRISIEFELVKTDEIILSDVIPKERDLTLLPFDDKSYIISNRNGFAVMKKNDPGAGTSEHQLFIRQIAFRGKSKSKQFFPGSNPIIVSNYMNNVSALFADPQSVDQYRTGYLYRLKEVDEQWNNTSGPEINYFHLKPGEYHLEIKPIGGDNLLISSFTILPPWYRTIWAYIAYFIAWGLVALGAYFWFQGKLERQRKLVEFEVRQTTLENKLESTNMELMLTMRYLIQKNETLTLMREEIDNLKNTAGTYPVKFIKKLDGYLAQGLEMQTKEWQMAVSNLKLSQEGYFKKLKEKYPRLTTNDVRMCSYLRMNFNSKEIAQLLNISTRAVEISRYRLRKKLDLPHDRNLTEFLMQDGF